MSLYHIVLVDKPLEPAGLIPPTLESHFVVDAETPRHAQKLAQQQSVVQHVKSVRELNSFNHPVYYLATTAYATHARPLCEAK